MRKTVLLLATVLGAVLASGLGAQTIKTADNISDRVNGWGGVIEQINTEFKASHPGVDFATESYPDQPYQQKIKIYAAAGQLPEVFKYWSFTSLLKPLVDNNFVAPLDRAAFEKYGYIAGALDSNVYNGKLYGIPVSADFWVIYYNKKLFKDAGVSVPTTVDQLLATIGKFKAKNIVPMTTDGKDGWPFSITYDQILERITGDPKLPQQALDRKIKFTDPRFVEAARQLQNLVKAGLFNSDVMISDYGTSRNLFGQGKAAMYLMGPWEMGLATDANFSQEFRDNVDAMKFPTIKGGKGSIDDLFAWFGGNYVVSANAKNAALASEYLKFYASRFPALAWEKGAAFPAQKVAARDSDTTVAKTLLKIAGDAKLTTGSASLDLSTPQFKEDNQNAMRELCSLLITPEVFAQKLDAAAEKASKSK
jgi:raffinose/stachyose/melibiose transport system substrate-binding protein